MQQPGAAVEGSHEVPERKGPAAEAPNQAVLVIHGIGQQLAFQPLDGFANGLRGTLRGQGSKVALTHFKLQRGGAFDHFLRMEADRPAGEGAPLRLDIYEFYWASLTQGEASFRDVVSWLWRTAFTPLRHFSFNIPLLIERAGNTAIRTERWGRLAGEFLRELWRLLYIPILGLLIAGGAALLVAQSGALVKSLFESLRPSVRILATWKGGSTALLFLGVAGAVTALVISLPKQLIELTRLRTMRPGFFDLVRGQAEKAFAQAAPAQSALRRLIAGAAWAVKGGFEESGRWVFEIRARVVLFFLSGAALLGLGALLWSLASPRPLCVAGLCASPVVYQILQRFGAAGTTAFASTVGLIALGLLLKRVFVDYLADVALYTTADENTVFFKTRSAILEEATTKLRVLLQDRSYARVAVAGHSLGSVIGYDAINRLRVEAEISGGAGAVAWALPSWLGKVLRDAAPAPSDQVAGPVETQPQAVARGGPAIAASITPEEFGKLRTFITFGSPLNKVLYFFRSKLKPYETVRAHILNELHGLRRLPTLLTSDPDIRDPTPPLADRLYWLNVYSPMDPVSARLVYYRDVHEVRRWFPIFGKCHVDYWHDKKFYREVLKALTH